MPAKSGPLLGLISLWRGQMMGSPLDSLEQLVAASRARELSRMRHDGLPSEVLSRFVAHAVDSTPYYAGVAPGASGDLARFQPISRKLVAEQPEMFLSTSFQRADL